MSMYSYSTHELYSGFNRRPPSWSHVPPADRTRLSNNTYDDIDGLSKHDHRFKISRRDGVPIRYWCPRVLLRDPRVAALAYE